MHETVLSDTEEAIASRKKEIRAHTWPILRTVLYGYFLVWLAAELLKSWGSELPQIVWFVPFFGPIYLLLMGPLAIFLPRKLIFSENKLISESVERKSVKWSSVLSWEIVENERNTEFFVLKFLKTHNRTVYFRIHNSHGKDSIRELVQKYGRI